MNQRAVSETELRIHVLFTIPLITIIMNVISTTAYDITEPFDHTLILALRVSRTGAYTYPGELIGEFRGYLRELPARLDVGSTSTIYFYEKLIKPCCRSGWEADGWQQLDDEQGISSEPLLDNTYRAGGARQPLAPIFALQQEQGTMTSPKLPASFSAVRDDNITDILCLKILAKVPEGSRISVIAENTDESGVIEIGEIIGNSDYEWRFTQLERTKTPGLRGHVRLVYIGKQPKDAINKILIQWSTFCADEKQVLDYYNAPFMRKGSTQAHYSLMIPVGKLGKVRSEPCMNGGSLDLDLGLCHCASGFAGVVCENSCGPNKYGVHCSGTCAIAEGDDRQCAGFLLCSKTGCECFAGFQGERCTEPCPQGVYGSDCDQKCGKCADEEVCDRYSGRCENGCEDGQQPPFCQEECGLTSDKLSNPKETNQFFWHVGIYERKKKSYTQVCSASLVRPRYLLSAAWCFFSENSLSVKPASRFTVLFGTDKQHCFTDDTYPPGVEIRSISSIHVPPLYRGSKRSHSDDIALVQLERPVATTIAIAPLCYEPVQAKSSELIDGDFGFVVGWGLHDKECSPNQRWKGYDMEYIAHESCFSEITGIVLSFTDTEKFCTKLIDDKNGSLVSGRDVGDIGSGFVYSKYDVWYIHGVKSGALLNVSDSDIALYTKISSYIEWITATWNKLDIQQGVKENT